jgi:small-conductance mechanosensitive channel
MAAELAQFLQELETGARALIPDLFRLWTLIQLALIVVVTAAALVAGRLIERRLEPRVRAIHGRRGLLRLLAILLRRIGWMLTSVGLWLTVIVLQASTWPSRSYLVVIAAQLATAWVVISIVSRLIRNRFLARAVAYAAWVVAALVITGLWDEAARLLDAAGFAVGTFRVSILFLLKAAFVVGLLLWLAVAVGNFTERRLAASAELTPTLRVLLGKLVKIALVTLAVVAALTSIGIDLTALTVFSGALGVGIGFGLQRVVSNFVSGVIILLDKSIKPGDTVSLGGETFGWIRSLRARFVSVVTRDGQEYLIPNEDFITQRVVNWSFTDPLVRVDVHFGVAYDSDPHAVRRLAVEAAKAVARIQERPAPVCHLTGFGDSSLDFILRFWIADPQNGMTNVRGAVLLACWDAFKAAGIAIPFPHREVIMRTPVEVRMAAGQSREGEASA